MEQEKRLYRSTYDRIIGGVAGGLGEYFVIDPVIIRLLFVLMFLFGGSGIIIYIVLWIFIPENTTYFYNDNFKTKENMENEKSNPMNFEDKKEMKPSYEKKHGSLIAGIILITLGALFLVDRYVPTINFGDLWPVLLIAIGGYFIYKSTRKDEEQ
ncbi:MAG: PspC domain-containing protein [Bacteroidales bacterium]|nr:PspC domain-containing protein [Bacteroidales bacterium]